MLRFLQFAPVLLTGRVPEPGRPDASSGSRVDAWGRGMPADNAAVAAVCSAVPRSFADAACLLCD